MKRVVITGATGFIGSWLVREMLRNQIEVIALVRNKYTKKFDNLENRNLLRLIQYCTDDFRELEKNQIRLMLFIILHGRVCLTSRKMMGSCS